MGHNNPAISVFLTCYREGRLLLNAISSVERQSDKDFEFFIVNDCSPDKVTNEICLALEKDRQIRVIWRSKNGGLAAARNTGFALMKGEIGIPLDADDVLPENAVSIIRRGFSGQNCLDYIFGNYILHDVQSGLEKECCCKFLTGENGELDPKQLVKSWRLLGTSPCTKNLWKKIGGYSLNYSNDLQDKDFWIRAVQSGFRGYFVDEIIYIWNRSSDGMNNSVTEKAQNRLLLEHLDFFKAHWNHTQTLNGLVSVKQYKQLRSYATSCLRKGVISPRLLFIALTPYQLLRAYYEAGVSSKVRSMFAQEQKKQ